MRWTPGCGRSGCPAARLASPGSGSGSGRCSERGRAGMQRPGKTGHGKGRPGRNARCRTWPTGCGRRAGPASSCRSPAIGSAIRVRLPVRNPGKIGIRARPRARRTGWEPGATCRPVRPSRSPWKPGRAKPSPCGDEAPLPASTAARAACRSTARSRAAWSASTGPGIPDPGSEAGTGRAPGQAPGPPG